jgi:hypothetical protein
MPEPLGALYQAVLRMLTPSPSLLKCTIIYVMSFDESNRDLFSSTLEEFRQFDDAFQERMNGPDAVNWLYQPVNTVTMSLSRSHVFFPADFHESVDQTDLTIHADNVEEALLSDPSTLYFPFDVFSKL